MIYFFGSKFVLWLSRTLLLILMLIESHNICIQSPLERSCFGATSSWPQDTSRECFYLQFQLSLRPQCILVLPSLQKLWLPKSETWWQTPQWNTHNCQTNVPWSSYTQCGLLTPKGQSKFVPKSFQNSSFQFKTLSKHIGTFHGGTNCMDGSFVELGLFSQIFTHSHVQNRKIVMWSCTLILLGNNDCPHINVGLGL